MNGPIRESERAERMRLTNENVRLRSLLAERDEEIEDLRSVLKLVATGIWRKPEMNACGLSGAAVVVHEVERVLKQEDL